MSSGTLLVLLAVWPFVAAVLVGLTDRWSEHSPKVALGATLVQAALTLSASAATPAAGSFPEWELPFSALAMDGLSEPLVMLTSFLGILAVLASWRVSRRPAAHHALLLALQGAVTTVFLADNVVLFYVAWEAVLIPMYFLIGVWGHEGRRHAATKFFLFTFVGSALMLVGLVVAAYAEGIFALHRMMPLSGWKEPFVFWLLAAGFLVKIPVWPLHTWLPDAHVQAPTAGSMMLAGVLLKMGGYGLIRVAMRLAPSAYADARPVLAVLGVIGIAYGAAMAFAQSDLKRLVAYSSVSHMGFVTLAIAVGTPAALSAAMLGMVSHGVVAPLLFFLAGSLHDRTHTFDLTRIRGIGSAARAWSVAFVFTALASAGLPALSGFPGEFLTVTETFRVWGWWAALAAVMVVPAAAYNLRAVRIVVQGEPSSEWQGLAPLSVRESLLAATLALAIFGLGVWPGPVVSTVLPAASKVAGLVAEVVR